MENTDNTTHSHKRVADAVYKALSELSGLDAYRLQPKCHISIVIKKMLWFDDGFDMPIFLMILEGILGVKNLEKSFPVVSVCDDMTIGDFVSVITHHTNRCLEH